MQIQKETFGISDAKYFHIVYSLVLVLPPVSNPTFSARIIWNLVFATVSVCPHLPLSKSIAMQSRFQQTA